MSSLRKNTNYTSIWKLRKKTFRMSAHTCVFPCITSNILRLFIWTLRSSSSTALSRSSCVVNGITSYKKEEIINSCLKQDMGKKSGSQIQENRWIDVTFPFIPNNLKIRFTNNILSYYQNAPAKVWSPNLTLSLEAFS